MFQQVKNNSELQYIQRQARAKPSKYSFFYYNSIFRLYGYICTLNHFNNRIIIFGSVFDKF